MKNNVMTFAESSLLPVLTIAREAGQKIMGLYELADDARQSVEVFIKSDNSPVTTADLRSSQFIYDELKKLDPSIPVLSEENDETADPDALYWAVDPLDGTKEFLAKTGGFAVKIALIYKGEPVLGAVYAPAFDTLYYSMKGSKSYKIKGNEGVKEISVAVPKKGALTTLFNTLHADIRLYDSEAEKLRQKGLDVPEVPDGKASLPRQLQVAEGLADVFVGVGRTLETGGGYVWDTAPDWLILKNAGGALLSLPDYKDMTYPASREKLPSYICIGNKLGKSLFT